MKSFFLLSLLLVLGTNSFAQQASGKLMDDKNSPIPFANVLLFDILDSSLKSTALSDSAGLFVIKLPSESKSYYLDIQMMGFDSYKSDVFIGAKNFGNVTLKSSSINLDAVEIKVKKQFIEVTGRGVVLNIAESPILQGSNSKDILEKIPGAIVNQDGSVSLKGKQNLLIYIDGKATNLALEDLVRLLESTPASEIEKVEVFETPPAKFDAAGNAGIINFMTKKGKMLGYNGSVNLNTGYGNFHKISPSASLNYRNKKFNAFGSGWYYNNMFDHYATMDMNMVVNNQSSSFFNDFHRIMHPIGFGSRIGLDYFINEKTTIGYLANLYDGNMNGWEPSSVKVKGPAESAYDYLDAIQNFDYYWSGQSHNINLKHEIGKQESLNVDFDYANRKNGNQTSNNNEYFLDNSSLLTKYILQKGNAISNIYAGKLDYEKPIYYDISMSVGAKASYVKTDAEFKSYDGIDENNTSENLNASNDFKYNEAIYAGYAVFAKKWKEKWSADLGLRVEHTQAQGISPTTSTNFTKSYTNFFPNVGLAYKIVDKYSWSGSFSRRIDRPNYYQLNPFQAQTNPFNFHQGNPNLNPQTTSVFNVSFGLKDKWFFTLSAANTQGLMNEVLQQDEVLQRQVHTTENLDHFYNYSFNISAPFQVKKWWSMNLNGTLYYNEMSSNFNWGVVGYDILSFSLNMQQNFTLPKNFKLELSGYYNYDSYWNIWFVEPHYQLDFGVNKSYKKFNFNLSVKDFLNIREGNGGVFQGNIYMPTTYKPESRKVMLNISYRFGNQKIKESRQRSTGSEELQKRAGD